MANPQRNNTMVRFDSDIDTLIRLIAKRKHQTISEVIRGYVFEGLFGDDMVWIDEDGDMHIT